MNTSNNTIRIITQGFYGNRVATEIERENVNFFLKGILSPELFPDEDKKVNRKIVKVPSTDNIVIVYDQNKEDRYVNETFSEIHKRSGEEYKEHTGKEMTMYVSCEIPEIDLTLHTRCFACRIDENGELQSLENGDSKYFIDYFTI